MHNERTHAICVVLSVRFSVHNFWVRTMRTPFISARAEGGEVAAAAAAAAGGGGGQVSLSTMMVFEHLGPAYTSIYIYLLLVGFF